MRVIIMVLFVGILLSLAAGCSSKTDNVKLFTTKLSSITLEEPMTLYKNPNSDGPVIGTASAGKYKVYEVKTTDNDTKTWVKIEYNGVKGYILGNVVQEK